MVCIVHDIPIPKSILSKGPPKQADTAIGENPCLAIAELETKSPMLLPQASNVNPRIALLKPNTIPNICSKLTISFAVV